MSWRETSGERPADPRQPERALAELIALDRTRAVVLQPNLNERVGQNVARLRKAAGLSQAALALFLTKHGVPFQQQTVLKVESGSRPLKFAEALVLSGALGVSLDDLAKLSDEPTEAHR